MIENSEIPTIPFYFVFFYSCAFLCLRLFFFFFSFLLFSFIFSYYLICQLHLVVAAVAAVCLTVAVAACACTMPCRPAITTQRGISGLARQGRRLELVKLVFSAPSRRNGSGQHDLRRSTGETVYLNDVWLVEQQNSSRSCPRSHTKPLLSVASPNLEVPCSQVPTKEIAISSRHRP
jgi:hypothetical protein